MASSPEPRSGLRARLRDLSVGRKLFLGFGAVALVVLFLVVAFLAALNNLSAAKTTITDRALPAVAAADGVRFAAANLGAGQRAYLVDGGASRAAFDSSVEDFRIALEQLRATARGATQQALVTKIGTGFDTYVMTDQLIWQALQEGRDDVARNLSLGPEALDYAFITADAQTLADLARAGETSASASFESTDRAARITAWSLGALAVVLVGVLSIIVTRSIQRPLARVQRAAEEAAEGDLSAEAVVTSNDETGRLAAAFNSMLLNLREREARAREDHARAELDGRLSRALDMADSEVNSYEVIDHALGEILGGRPVELLLADSSKAHLEATPVAGADGNRPGCPVGSPFDCTAVRNGHTMTFPSSQALDACPMLRDRPAGACSAVCVPVSFMGRAMGVLHATGPEHAAQDAHETDALEMLTSKAGARIGMIRSLARTQEQASTDGLTGLLNRRTFETQARALHRSGVPFALVLADLDHFKRLNDTHGHEAGDRALRVFAEVLTSNARAGDLIARFGGEEFLLLLPRATTDDAVDTCDRLRLELSGRLASAEVPRFTASFGIADATWSERLDDIVRMADQALYRSKHEGRDRATIGDPTQLITRPDPSSGTALTMLPSGFAAIGAHDDPLDP